MAAAFADKSPVARFFLCHFLVVSCITVSKYFIILVSHKRFYGVKSVLFKEK